MPDIEFSLPGNMDFNINDKKGDFIVEQYFPAYRKTMTRNV
jgi:hypothetical protein